MLDTLINVTRIAEKLRHHIEKQELAKAKAMIAAEVMANLAQLALTEYYRVRPMTTPGMFLSEQTRYSIFITDKAGMVIRTTTQESRLERAVVEAIEQALAVDGLQSGRRFRNYIGSLEFLIGLNNAIPMVDPSEAQADFVTRGMASVRQIIMQDLSKIFL